MDTTTLAKLYAVNAGVLRMNLDGFTHRESVEMPDGGGNCLNWIVGHVAFYRRTILEFLEQEPVWDAAAANHYRRGESLTDPADAIALETLIDAFERSVEPVARGFAAMRAARLTMPAPHEFPGGMKTIGEGLAFLHFHEAYHIGQVSMHRRLAGKPGAIA